MIHLHSTLHCLLNPLTVQQLVCDEYLGTAAAGLGLRPPIHFDRLTVIKKTS